MNDTTDTTDTPSVVERTRKVDVGGQIFAAHFIGELIDDVRPCWRASWTATIWVICK